MTLERLWNIPATAADTRVGDADVSGRSEEGVTTPPILLGDPPFLGRRAYGRSGVARETHGVGPRVREDGSGDSRRDGGLRGKFCLHGKSCRRGKLECAEELAGAEEVSCAGEIAGAMAIASQYSQCYPYLYFMKKSNIDVCLAVFMESCLMSVSVSSSGCKCFWPILDVHREMLLFH